MLKLSVEEIQNIIRPCCYNHRTKRHWGIHCTNSNQRRHGVVEHRWNRVRRPA
jgi:hypothetical protein